MVDMPVTPEVVQEVAAKAAKKVRTPKAKVEKDYTVLLSSAGLPVKASGAVQSGYLTDCHNAFETIAVQRGKKAYTTVYGDEKVQIKPWQLKAIQFLALAVATNPMSDSGIGYRKWVAEHAKELLEWGSDMNIKVSYTEKKVIGGLVFSVADAISLAQSYARVTDDSIKLFKVKAVTPRVRGSKGGGSDKAIDI